VRVIAHKTNTNSPAREAIQGQTLDPLSCGFAEEYGTLRYEVTARTTHPFDSPLPHQTSLA